VRGYSTQRSGLAAFVDGTRSVIPCREGWGLGVDERCQGVGGAVRIVL